MDFRVGRGDEEFTPWPALSDISITMVLLLVFMIILQFKETRQEQIIQRELSRQQRTVSEAIRRVSDGSVRIDSISPGRQRLTFRDAALFDICRADLKANGRALLLRVGEVLQMNASRLATINVEGHTDTLSISGKNGCYFRSNWELSSARATTVVSLWSNETQIGKNKMSAIGRSQYVPVVAGAEGDLASNRRIEVILEYNRKAPTSQGANGVPQR